MNITHIALACALAVGGSAAFAQNETTNTPNPNASVSAKELGDKVKRGAKRVGDATKRTYNKARNKIDAAQERNASNGTTANSGQQSDTQVRAMGTDGQTRGTSSMSSSMETSPTRQQRIDSAYSNYQTQQKK